MKLLLPYAFVAALVLVGCQPAPTTETTSNAAQPTETMPSKLVFAFQRQKDPAQLKEDADAVGARLTEKLGMPVEVVVPTSYGATVQALISKRADVAYMSSLPYLLAKKETGVEILLAEQREGKAVYDSVFVVAKDSPIQTLEDLKGKRIAFTSATSSSGYVFPYGHLVEKGLMTAGAKPDTFFSQFSFAGGYDKALMAVARGQADVAAVSAYTMEGDTADKYLPAEERNKLRILARVPNVPTHLIAVRSDLPKEIKDKVKQTLLALSQDEPERMRDVYGAASFAEADESHVASAQAALERTGLGAEAVVEK